MRYDVLAIARERWPDSWSTAENSGQWHASGPTFSSTRKRATLVEVSLLLQGAVSLSPHFHSSYRGISCRLSSNFNEEMCMSKKITLPSGKKASYQRCQRYVLWRHGRTAHTFQIKAQQAAESGIEDPVERGLSLFESLSQAEAKKLQAFADDIVKNSTDIKDPGELSEADYWYIFGLVLYSSPDATIETEDGETDQKSVETFPLQPILQDAGANVPDVQTESKSENGNQVATSL
jgi:hypothetical protein